MNKIRKQPKQYVHALKAEVQKFKDEKTIQTNHGTILTKEGQAPYQDLISQMESQYPLPLMREISGLSIVAIQQITQFESLIEHKVPVESLIDKFCVAAEGVRSLILKDVEGVPVEAMLMRLLVGDGDRKRTGRKKLLSPICKAIGCAISRDMLIVNVGESARDNRDFVEEYISHIHEPIGNKIQPQNQPIQVIKSNEKPIEQGDHFVVKKTSKSQNIQKAGRTYVVTEIEAIYNDGHIEKTVEEELLR